jgi:hypothetical protein
MLTLNDFKQKYSQELNGLSEDEIKNYYSVYLEDPFEFNSDMIG